jgi:hypothetical protein
VVKGGRPSPGRPRCAGGLRCIPVFAGIPAQPPRSVPVPRQSWGRVPGHPGPLAPNRDWSRPPGSIRLNALAAASAGRAGASCGRWPGAGDARSQLCSAVLPWLASGPNLPAAAIAVIERPHRQRGVAVPQAADAGWERQRCGRHTRPPMALVAAESQLMASTRRSRPSHRRAAGYCKGSCGNSASSGLDYPAGSAWTRRIRGELAIAGIPEAASLFGLIGCGVIWVITIQDEEMQPQSHSAIGLRSSAAWPPAAMHFGHQPKDGQWTRRVAPLGLDRRFPLVPA